jgi:hypothetical protein
MLCSGRRLSGVSCGEVAYVQIVIATKIPRGRHLSSYSSGVMSRKIKHWLKEANS